MKIRTIKNNLRVLLAALILYAAPHPASAQTPDWAQPASATHKQVSPPADFHRPARTSDTPIGIFDGQSDVGAALAPGSSHYDAATKQYTIISAGYNVWYVRDEFRYLWKKMSGDVSLAADINFPDTLGFGDRKALLVIRQSLDDDSKEALVALHGAGMIHLAQRPAKGLRVKDMEYRIGSRGGLPGGKTPDDLVLAHARRIGIEKRGDSFALFVSMDGEPMHQFGAPIRLHIDGPFYVGIGFCSHLPDKVDTATLSNVVLVNAAGEVQGGSNEKADQAGGPAVFLMDAGRLAELKKELARQDTGAIALLDRLREQADKLMAMRPISVMDKSATPVSGSKHDYMSQAPYFWYDSTKPNGLPYMRRDGQRNPEIYGITDRSYLDDLDNAARILGLAWWLTGEEKYAQKASILLKRWFLDDSTRMNPNLNYGQAIPGFNHGRGIGIIETISLTGIADASGLLEGSAAWTTADADALRQWFAKYLDWMLNSRNGREEHATTNNHVIWYLAQATDFALFAGNSGQAKELAEEGKSKIEAQIRSDGKMPEELARTNGLGYTSYNLQALFALATVAKLAGVDLWNYKNSTGAGIRTALDWLSPYALGEKKWEYQQISPYNKTEFYLLLLEAGKIYSDGKYVAEAQAIGTDGLSGKQKILFYFSFIN